MGTTAQNPAEAAKQAVENDAILGGGRSFRLTEGRSVPQGSEEGKKLGRPDIMGTADVAAIFGPGTPRDYSEKVVMQLKMQE